ncbi:MAG: response regulator transcription factor [Gammaproteobacteria bacterium]|nr:response regulator transcription factor [Gammaproteobacteria bacterium]
MDRLKTIIVDDEPLARRLLKTYLQEHPQIDLVAECQNGREAINAAQQMEPDLMFVDIQMPGINGFEVVKRLQSDVMPMIVFCTAYEKYALDAFDINAVDYILKPMDRERVERSVMRSLERHKNVDATASKTPILGALEMIAEKVAADLSGAGPAEEKEQAEANLSRKLAIKDRDLITMVDQEDIDWVDAAGDYMCIHVAGDTHIMRATLKHLLGQLDSSIFKQVHRSTIVNVNRIQKITPCSKGEYLLHIGTDAQIKVSRNYRTAIKQYIEKFG